VTAERVCAVCGHDRRADLEASWVRWLSSGRERHEAATRCTDRSACRARVEAADDEWWPIDAEGAKP
jgi:hypothetical protein